MLEIPRFVQNDNQWRRDKSPPPTPPENDFYFLDGGVLRGCSLTPSNSGDSSLRSE